MSATNPEKIDVELLSAERMDAEEIQHYVRKVFDYFKAKNQDRVLDALKGVPCTIIQVKHHPWFGAAVLVGYEGDQIELKSHWSGGTGHNARTIIPFLTPEDRERGYGWSELRVDGEAPRIIDTSGNQNYWLWTGSSRYNEVRVGINLALKVPGTSPFILPGIKLPTNLGPEKTLEVPVKDVVLMKFSEETRKSIWGQIGVSLHSVAIISEVAAN
jgi:hypothetical protein